MKKDTVCTVSLFCHLSDVVLLVLLILTVLLILLVLTILLVLLLILLILTIFHCCDLFPFLITKATCYRSIILYRPAVSYTFFARKIFLAFLKQMWYSTY